MDHMYLVDGSAFIHRAFHAIPMLTRRSDGLPVNALRGFVDMLYGLLNKRAADEEPTHLAVVFDHPRSRERRQALEPAYKAQRPPLPLELRVQFPLIRRAARAFDIAVIEEPGLEADDLIATYAAKAAHGGGTATIVSADKDFYQLVSDRITMWDPRGVVDKSEHAPPGKRIGPPEVEERFGVRPDQMCDFLALVGDTADNIKGVEGIGPKKAAQLLGTYGELERVLANAPYLKQPATREKLVRDADQARRARVLVELNRHIPVTNPYEELTLFERDPRRLACFLKGAELFIQCRRVCDDAGLDIDDIEPDPEMAKPGAGTGWSENDAA